jgi:hypothetical protein
MISTAFVESTANQVISKRMVKKQQMSWTPRGLIYSYRSERGYSTTNWRMCSGDGIRSSVLLLREPRPSSGLQLARLDKIFTIRAIEPPTGGSTNRHAFPIRTHLQAVHAGGQVTRRNLQPVLYIHVLGIHCPFPRNGFRLRATLRQMVVVGSMQFPSSP